MRLTSRKETSSTIEERGLRLDGKIIGQHMDTIVRDLMMGGVKRGQRSACKRLERTLEGATW